MSMAPLGKPVVPEVYWMLIGSSNWSAASRPGAQLLGDRSPLGEQLLPVAVEEDDALESGQLAAHLASIAT